MKDTKVFAIGFQKTGTSSLGKALETLGYQVGGYWDFRDMANQEGLTWEEIEHRAFELAERFDAFKDTPWPVLYKKLDERYPGSKFILVTRDSEKWIQSASKDFMAHPNMIHRLIYGCDFPVGNEQVWIDRYEQHNRDVVAYFSGRPNDFVSMHLDRGEVTFKSICGFLKCEIPDEPWPHVNQIRDKKRRMFKTRLLSKLGIR